MGKAAGKRIENKSPSPPHRFCNGFAWNFSCMSSRARSGAAAGGASCPGLGLGLGPGPGPGLGPARGSVEVGMGRSAASRPGPVRGARTPARPRTGRTENRPAVAQGRRCTESRPRYAFLGYKQQPCSGRAGLSVEGEPLTVPGAGAAAARP